MKKIMIVTVFPSLVLVLMNKVHQTLKTAYDYISNQLKIRDKYSFTRGVFESILLWCDKTRSFHFDILLTGSGANVPRL